MPWPIEPPVALHAHEFLEWLSVPGMPKTFALGCFARYQTLYAQQVRAINLIDALERMGMLEKGDRVLVAGGGIAGMTAALAATVRGAKVTLVEASDELIPFQRASHGRYLHPNAYDWPFAGSHAETILPFMNWTAQYSQDVFTMLEDEFRRLRVKHGNLDILLSHSLVGIEDTEAGARIKVRNTTDEFCIEGSTIVLAIGFGREFRRPDIPAYWDGDGITSKNDKTSSWLVSGFGDGALTDLARLLVKGFNHEEVVKLVVENEELTKDVAARLIQHTSVREAFGNVSPTLRSKVKQSFEYRADNVVTFCAPKESYLDSKESCLLNRFLTYLLEDRLTFRSGKLSEIPSQRASPPFYEVDFIAAPDNKTGTSIDPDTKSFDGIIPRHGVDAVNINGKKVPRVWAEPGLHAIWDRCEGKRLAWTDLGEGLSKFDDRTRVPIFQREQFAAAPADFELFPKDRDHVHLRVLVVTSSISPSPGSRPLWDVVRDTIPAFNEKVKGALNLNKNDVLQVDVKHIRCQKEEWSSQWFVHAVRQLCRADVVFFDISDFQPLVMTLLGIRSVARRGINIICTYDPINSALWSRLPFNIKELYPIGIGPDTTNQSRRLGKTLLDALAKRRAFPEYLDLPGFNALRRVSLSTRFQRTILWDEKGGGILWLCSFHSDYAAATNASTIQDKMQAMFGDDIELRRVTDIESPELVSQKLFDAIRRYEFCLVDWTQWSSNLFFEFGVRLAASPLAPVCYISDHPKAPWFSRDVMPADSNGRYEKQQDQIDWLTKAFAAISYRVGDSWSAAEARRRVDAMREASNTPGEPSIAPTYGFFRFDRIYSLIASEVHDGEEPHKTPSILLREAAEHLVRESAGIVSVPAIYADKNSQLRNNARTCALEFMVAEWRYAVGERRLAGSANDEAKREIVNLANRVKRMLGTFDESDQRKRQLLAEIDKEVRRGEELLKTPSMLLREAAERLVGDSGGIASVPAIYADKNSQLNARRRALEFMVAEWRYVVGDMRLTGSASDEAKREIINLANRVKTMLGTFDDSDQRKQQLLSEIDEEEKA
jgi:thioredoxin reductase